ncbi:uncharacterized protein TRAVEDRAFT_22578 [Trametes versicolor FP-101664 SS1]|uniref:uncharacterized protein n=1 Tax=Trametes versicolor (strain FP-101664) TaxID=717944 RepID=UPI0004624912|nr:uncharacterized protein TRAVEDRAFT_22578 [Trametes versicolor FP-101664 SS1]EIW54650.1 hypothetical protein TRAVEDRAFT_22578 [Trametes versicolor FP-101664 SS1]
MSFTTTECEPSHFHLNAEAAEFKSQLEDALHGPDAAPSIPSLDTIFHDNMQKTSEKAVENVKGLTASICDIRTSFAAISKDLHSFDLQAKVTGATQGPPPLKPDWERFHACSRQKFEDLLNQSHKNARQAIAVLNNYNDLFPEGEDIDASKYDDIKAEIQNVIMGIDGDGEKAFEIEQGFTTLARNIREFGITIEKTVNVNSSRVLNKLNETRTRVDGLSLKLSGVKSEMRNAGLACVACLSAGAISAAFLFFTLSPTSAHAFAVGFIGIAGPALPDPFFPKASVLAAVPSAITFKDKIQEARDLKAQIKEGKEEMAQLCQQSALLVKYQSLMSSTKHDIEDLCAKIDAISGIWYALKADFQQLHAQLTKAAGPNIKYTSFMKKKIANSRVVYSRLVQLLNAYIDGVQVFEKADGKGVGN